MLLPRKDTRLPCGDFFGGGFILIDLLLTSTDLMALGIEPGRAELVACMLPLCDAVPPLVIMFGPNGLVSVQSHPSDLISNPRKRSTISSDDAVTSCVTIRPNKTIWTYGA